MRLRFKPVLTWKQTHSLDLEGQFALALKASDRVVVIETPRLVTFKVRKRHDPPKVKR